MVKKLVTRVTDLDRAVRAHLRDCGSARARRRSMTTNQRERQRDLRSRSEELITAICHAPGVAEVLRTKLKRDADAVQRLLLTAPPSANELERVSELRARTRGRSPDRRPLFGAVHGCAHEVSAGLPGLGRKSR